MIPRRYLLMGLGAVLAILAALVGVDSCRKHDATQAETQSAIHQGEANAHVQQAQAIPDHSAELAQAQAVVAGERAENARLRRLVEAERRARVSDHAGAAVPDPAAVPADHRDELLAADAVLIAKQDAQIQGLQVALMDERKRSAEFKAAFEAERKATAAQQAATEAWKKAVTTSRWRGRIEGFAAGVALGYVARGQR